MSPDSGLDLDLDLLDLDAESSEFKDGAMPPPPGGAAPAPPMAGEPPAPSSTARGLSKGFGARAPPRIVSEDDRERCMSGVSTRELRLSLRMHDAASITTYTGLVIFMA